MTHLSDFDIQELHGLVGIWVTPESDGQQAVVSLELIGHGKPYARIWLHDPYRVEWGWGLPEHAICVWRETEAGPSQPCIVCEGPTVTEYQFGVQVARCPKCSPR